MITNEVKIYIGYCARYFVSTYEVFGNFNNWQYPYILEYDDIGVYFTAKVHTSYCYQFKFKNKFYDEWLLRDNIPTTTDYHNNINHVVYTYNNNHQAQIVDKIIHVESTKSEDTLLNCKICLENRTTVSLNCGHLLCLICANQITSNCPFCKEKIESKTNLFFI